MSRYNAATVLAMVFGLDISELRAARYQDTRTTGPVYTFGSEYYCCALLGKKPHQPNRDALNAWEWKPFDSSFAAGEGYQVWKAGGA